MSSTQIDPEKAEYIEYLNNEITQANLQFVVDLNEAQVDYTSRVNDQIDRRNERIDHLKSLLKNEGVMDV